MVPENSAFILEELSLSLSLSFSGDASRDHTVKREQECRVSTTSRGRTERRSAHRRSLAQTSKQEEGGSIRMRREGRLSGKPSNKSRKIGGRGVTGDVRCCSSSSSSSHKKKNHTLIPVSKSQSKVKGRLKRSAYDVTFNHLLEDWRVCSSSRSSFIAPHSRTARKPSPASQSLWDSDTDQSSGEVCDPCENDEDAGKLQQEQQEEEEEKDEVSAMAIMIDTALQNMRNRKRKPEAAACLLTENYEEARREEEVDASGDNQAEILDCYKAACNNNELQFGSFFKDEMIVASSQQHKNRARSEDSWSEIEGSEPDIMSQESWEEDEES